MKNILTKIITVFIVVTIVAIGLKVSDNILASANASTNTVCGINNGWIWNGTQCVNTCDANHPWDPINKRCSTNFGYYSNVSYGSNTNCVVAYGSNFYFNGSSCVERTIRDNANYYGNPFNGSTTVPVYGNYNYNYNYNYSYTTQNPTQNHGYTYTHPNTNTSHYVNNNVYYENYRNPGRVNESIIYYNTYTNTNYNPNDAHNAIHNDSNTYSGRKNIDYYIYTITTTTSQPQGTPIYLGSNTKYNYYNNYSNPNWYSYNYDYRYDYNYSYNNYNNSNWYSGGYYDIYGNYRW